MTEWKRWGGGGYCREAVEGVVAEKLKLILLLDARFTVVW